ncbi:MAG: helix-turn-helix domain-containing protein [Nitrospirae bacterium]|nr:helix-turn-helix domain-containing protein [Nitrospirota bacterium]
MDEKLFLGIYTRLRQYTKANSDAGIARSLGITPQAFSSFKKEQKIPSDLLIKYCFMNNVSIDWLLTGEAKVYKEDKTLRHPYGYRREIPEAEKDKVRMQRFIGFYWEKADDKERAWLEVQFRRCFPEYIEWVEKHKYDVPDEQCVMEQQKRYGSSTELPSDFSVNEVQKPYSVKKEEK